MNHAELSRDLALALGYYPKSVRIALGATSADVYRITNDMGPYWRVFDYRSPDVALPLLRWLMMNFAATVDYGCSSQIRVRNEIPRN